MVPSKQIENIIRDIKPLDYQGKLDILEQLVRFLRRHGIKEAGRKHSLLELEGLGKEIWRDIDTDDYMVTVLPVPFLFPNRGPLF
jgi:hypothetical protein